MQTLGEMVAFSLTSEVTRGGWKRSGENLENKALGVVVPRYPWRDGIKVRGKKVPLTDRDESAISSAARQWRQWDDECQRQAALVAFVDKFEAAYGNNEKD